MTCLVGALLPAPAAWVLFTTGLVTAGLLLAGRGEPLAARVLFGSRPARPEELAVLAPALTLLSRAALGPPLIDLRVREGQPAVAAGGMGRRTVTVTGGLLDAARDGTLPLEQAAAVIGHAAAVVVHRWVRCDAAIAFWSLPWQVLRVLAEAVASGVRRLPGTSLVWRARAGVLIVAAVQQTQAHQWMLAVVTGVIGAASYATPAWERAWQQRLLSGGDRAAAAAGFAVPLGAFLRRCPATRTVRARLHALDAPPLHPRPLGLVTTR
jgi:hypothetical protein